MKQGPIVKSVSTKEEKARKIIRQVKRATRKKFTA